MADNPFDVSKDPANQWHFLSCDIVKREAADLHGLCVQLIKLVFEQCETLNENPFDFIDAAAWHPQYRISFLPSDHSICFIQVSEPSSPPGSFESLAFIINSANKKYKRFGRSWKLEPEGDYDEQLQNICDWVHMYYRLEMEAEAAEAEASDGSDAEEPLDASATAADEEDPPGTEQEEAGHEGRMAPDEEDGASGVDALLLALDATSAGHAAGPPAHAVKRAAESAPLSEVGHAFKRQQQHAGASAQLWAAGEDDNDDDKAASILLSLVES